MKPRFFDEWHAGDVLEGVYRISHQHGPEHVLTAPPTGMPFYGFWYDPHDPLTQRLHGYIVRQGINYASREGLRACLAFCADALPF